MLFSNCKKNETDQEKWASPCVCLFAAARKGIYWNCKGLWGHSVSTVIKTFNEIGSTMNRKGSERLERQQANAISKEQPMKLLKTCQLRSIQSESWQKNLAHHIAKRDLGLFPYKMKSRQLLEPEHIRKRLAWCLAMKVLIDRKKKSLQSAEWSNLCSKTAKNGHSNGHSSAVSKDSYGLDNDHSQREASIGFCWCDFQLRSSLLSESCITKNFGIMNTWTFWRRRMDILTGWGDLSHSKAYPKMVSKFGAGFHHKRSVADKITESQSARLFSVVNSRKPCLSKTSPNNWIINCSIGTRMGCFGFGYTWSHCRWLSETFERMHWSKRKAFWIVYFEYLNNSNKYQFAPNFRFIYLIIST